MDDWADNAGDVSTVDGVTTCQVEAAISVLRDSGLLIPEAEAREAVLRSLVEDLLNALLA